VVIVVVQDVACKATEEMVEALLLPVITLGSVDLAQSLVSLLLVLLGLRFILLLLSLESSLVLSKESLLLLLILVLLLNDLSELAGLLLLSLVSESSSLGMDLLLLVPDGVDAVDVAIEVLLGFTSGMSKDSLHASELAVEGSHCLSISLSLVVESSLLNGILSHGSSGSWGHEVLGRWDVSWSHSLVDVGLDSWCNSICGLLESWGDLRNHVLDGLVWQHVLWKLLQALVHVIKLSWKDREILGHLTELLFERLGEGGELLWQSLELCLHGGELSWETLQRLCCSGNLLRCLLNWVCNLTHILSNCLGLALVALFKLL